MDTCAKCGAGLGVGRFCLNCGHPIGAPVAIPRPPVLRVRHVAPAPRAVEARDAGDPRPTVDEDSYSVPDSDSDGAWLLPAADPGDDEPTRLHWGAWVLAALTLIASVLLTLSFLEDGDTAAIDEPREPASSSAAGEDGGTDETTPRGRAVDVAGGATVRVPATAPPTTDLDGALVPYDAARIVDGDGETAWRMPGDGTGAEVTLTLAQRSVIERVGLVNGYAKRVQGVDWYPNNRRIRAVRWTFDDGTSVKQTLAENRRLQRLEIDPVTTGTVTLTLLRVTPPGAGEYGRDYTAISSVVLTGRPAG